MRQWWNNAHNFKASGWLLLGEIISRLVQFGVIVWFIRVAAIEQWGTLSYLFALGNIAVVVSNFGLSVYQPSRLPALSTSQRATQLQTLYQLRWFLTLTTIILFTGAITLLTTLPWFWAMLAIVTLTLTDLRGFIEATYRIAGKASYETFTKISASIVLSGILGITIFKTQSLTAILLAYSGAAIISIGMNIWLVRSLLPAKTSSVPWRSLLWQASPFAFSLFCNALLNYFDSAYLGWLGYTDQVAMYNAAYKPIFFITALAGMITNAYIPTLSASYKTNLQQFRSTLRELLLYCLAVAVPILIGGILLSGFIITTLYGDRYNAGGTIFAILIISTALIYVWAPLGNVLQATGSERDYLIGFIIATIINVGGNLVLVPHYGMYASAWLMVLSQGILLVWFAQRVWRKF